MTDAYPDDNPKTVLGMAKPGLQAVPPLALFVLGQAMQDGERKYGRFNYRDARVTAATYYNAMLRHLLAWWDGQDAAEDTGVHHLGHLMACAAILLDAEAAGKLNDDRVKQEGPLPAWLRSNVVPPAGGVFLRDGEG